jgi:uncharacterized membrane protein YgcG
MADGDRKDAVIRRSMKLWKVLVAGGMALAAACAGMHKESSSGSGNDGSSTGTSNNGGNSNGGGASGW